MRKATQHQAFIRDDGLIIKVGGKYAIQFDGLIHDPLVGYVLTIFNRLYSDDVECVVEFEETRTTDYVKISEFRREVTDESGDG